MSTVIQVSGNFLFYELMMLYGMVSVMVSFCEGIVTGKQIGRAHV